MIVLMQSILNSTADSFTKYLNNKTLNLFIGHITFLKLYMLVLKTTGFFSEKIVKLWLRIFRVWSFLLYSTTKLTKPGNHIHIIYIHQVVFYGVFYTKSQGIKLGTFLR